MTNEQYGQSTANGGMKIQSTGVVKNMFNKEFSTSTFGGNSGAPQVLPMPGPNVNQVNQVVAGGNVAQSNNIHKKRWMNQINQIAAGGNVAQSNNFNANPFFPKPYANQVNQIVAGNNVAQSNRFHKKRFNSPYRVNQVNQIVAGNNVAQSNHFHKKRFNQYNSGKITTQINNEYGNGAPAVLPMPGPNVNQVNQVVA